MTNQDPPQIPILENLSAEMRCGIFTNAQGKIMIVHDKPLASSIQWIEYCEIEDSFLLIHEDGHIQALGLQLDPKMRENLKHGTEVTIAYLLNKKIKSSQTVVFLIKSF